MGNFTRHNAPIVTAGVDDISWTAWQYDRPEKNDGIILAFRRFKSPYSTVNVNLGGISDGKIYQFRDADTGEVLDMLGQDFINKGFDITINDKRASKLYFYKTL